MRLQAAAADFGAHADAVVADFQNSLVVFLTGAEQDQAFPGGGGQEGLAAFGVGG